MQKVFFLSFFSILLWFLLLSMGFFSLSARKKIFAKLERREVEGAYNLLDPMVYGFFASYMYL